MKFLITTIFIASCLFSMAQQDMFWNDYSIVNPAMSGFEYQQHGAITYSDYFRNNTDDNLMMNYNARLSGKHGVGINLAQSFNTYNETNLLANYNYQFDLKSAGRLSTGVGFGFNRFYENEKYFSPNRTAPAESLINFQMNVGVAHQWKGLVSGLSIHNFTRFQEELGDGNFGIQSPSFVAHTAYNFKVGSNFQLTPRVLATYENQHNVSIQTNLEARLFDRVSAGILYTLDTRQLGFHAGYDIKNNLRLAYSFSSPLRQHNSLNYAAQGRHSFTLGFLLK